ncbi:hypothetical protein FoTM2_001677 [Fusarium oxysporum f. sp. vasinfectum]|uniref:Uncharacterized protein n=2 Tax=Fusarium oxysporum f. sp. conglutinans TaxID=100902 RepID=A0A8H6LS76_FUSOX|nr:hypothetical protein HZS61_000108 [Fusarium oxysporum f. sp. conglutinans]KAK2938459.1 hypothetical protein FoTM2_001677 [Fusarium oxysporum f. sp. vasinfectum]
MPSARAQMKRPVNSAPQSCLQTSPTLGDKPPQEGRTVKSHRGSEDSTTLWTSTSLSREGIFAQLSCSETSPTRTANLLRANCRRLSREARLFVSTQAGRNCLVTLGRAASTPVARRARRTVYGANMLPQTTDFGVTPDEARALHKKQHESDSKMVCLGLSGGCMMLSPVLWQLRFHVIAGKAEYIIDFFQPRGIRSKGKNATVFYPQGSPTVASAQSQAAAEDAAIQEEDGNL